MRYPLNRPVATLPVLATLLARCYASTVTIDPQPKQTLTSFGASGAWWPNDLVHFPQSTQVALGNFLFSKDGLWLSSYRYNMGGDGGNDTQQVTANGSRVESFLLRNGTYDWNRDQAGISFLKMAQQYAVPYITFFINAAPSAIAVNGAACGWSLTADRIQPFANYIVTVLSYWLSHGITDLKYISPMNEPDNNRSDCGQEGMAVVPSLRAPMFQALRKALNASSASRVDIIGDETSRVVTQALPEDPVDLLMSSDGYIIAIHNYDYPDDAGLATYYASIQNLTGGHPPPVKFTETCCSTTFGSGPSVFGEQYDPTMTNALIVARYAWQFLTIVQAESFDWWTAATTLPCSPKIDGLQCATQINNTAGYNSGLVYYDPNYNQTRDFNIYYTKRAFMMKHFAYFHRPGSVRYDVPQQQLPAGVHAIASKTSTSQMSGGWGWGNWGWGTKSVAPTWSVLFMNNQTRPVDITLEIPGKAAGLTRLVQTTNEQDFEDVSPLPPLSRGSAMLQLPASSLVTALFV
ncbi:hypothetical protein LTR62_008663 [Meristemomyces frigidus]|uniref:Endo-beta-1,6-galactanase-like domain-containing protein n=1 Tax=Meristemomyces frigidus TaxID=1508187 RepID=A0AAN7YCH5_9PEZI|nr:hypothetical protein LTR62_008663 [Meristemomyces frigidus]